MSLCLARKACANGVVVCTVCRLTSTPKAKRDEVLRSFQAQRKKYLNLLCTYVDSDTTPVLYGSLVSVWFTHWLVLCVVDCGKLPSVAKLAEKYEDFQMLVTLCQGIDSSAKLKEYMVRFKEQVWTNSTALCSYICRVLHCIKIWADCSYSKL